MFSLAGWDMMMTSVIAVIALCSLWLRLTIVRAEPKISAAAATFVPQSGEIQFEFLNDKLLSQPP